jgi:hypothetical protein
LGKFRQYKYKAVSFYGGFDTNKKYNRRILQAVIRSAEPLAVFPDINGFARAHAPETCVALAYVLRTVALQM